MPRPAAKARLAALLACVLVPAGCSTPPAELVEPRVRPTTKSFPHQSRENAVDLLFVIDDSGDMELPQVNLAASFPQLIEALRSEVFGPDASGKPCDAAHREGCSIPDLHIGVVSTDLGAASTTALPSCETPDGDGARLLVAPRTAGCTPPSQPFISFSRGQTNIPGPSADPIRAIEDAFACIARLGSAGCGFEQPLEAALRALDPRQSVNSGFRRDTALLVVVFLGDEDDCSARDGRLFEPAQEALGPLTSFRCFEFGVTCDENDRTAPGVRSGCAPSAELLYPVAERYERFFRGVAPPGRALLAAFVGPPDHVEVQIHGSRPMLAESCASAAASAAPAVRIASLVEAFAPDSQLTSICEPDFGPPLAALGAKIRRKLEAPCFPWPLLTANGGLVCQAGDAYGPELLCGQDCLHLASCDVVEIAGQGTSAERIAKVERCPLERWYPADWQQDRDCGARCPCWRIVRKGAAVCDAALGETPYGLDILRRDPAPAGAVVAARCFTSAEAWNGDREAITRITQCE